METRTEAPLQGRPTPGESGDESVSPSLRGRGAGEADRAPAYELKFRLDEARAAEVADRLRCVLSLDPHADPALGGAYEVASLYCDTPAWSVYFKEGEHAFCKYRVRRYGGAGEVYVERKSVRSRRVQKYRDAVPLDGLVRAAAGDGAPAWFGRELLARGLAPVCRVRYLRQALFGVLEDGPARVTFDRSVRGARAGGWSFEVSGDEVGVLDDVVVCELKFQGAMPGAFKRLVGEMGLEASGASKYRACIGALVPALARSGAGDVEHA